MSDQKTALKFLEYLNDTYSRLHKNYEDLFWLSYMGDHAKNKKLDEARSKRDDFRSDQKIKKETDDLLKNSNGRVRDRLKLWSHFFSLYQSPKEAAKYKNQANQLETAIRKIRSSRKEGYIDPKTKKFVPASENKMRMIMRTHPDEAYRKAAFTAMEKFPFDTLDKYIKLIKIRNDYAKALGYSDFYHYKIDIDEGMSKKELFSIFENIYKKTKYGFENVRKMEKTKPNLRKPWNFAYMVSGSFVKEEDPYFQFNKVLSYWGRSFAALGVDFKGGQVKLDLLDRKGKWNNGFCHYPDLVRFKNGKRFPGSTNFTSTAIPNQVGSGAQGIHTVFHEGGHAADRLNSEQEDVCINSEYPPSTVSWAETHSMFMDSISSSIEWRTRYAMNDQGKPYPFSLYEKKVRSTYPLRPLDMMGIIMVVFFEKEICECKNLTRKFVLDTAKKIFKKYMDRSEDSLMVLNIPHIYDWESSAYYHGYGLADLGVSQWRSYFFKKYGYIVDNPNVGKEMSQIWSYASMYPAKKLIKMATGKKLSPDSFIKSVTMPLDEIMSKAKKRIARLKKVPIYKKPVDLKGRITMVHGKKVISDNSKSFEEMDRKYQAWLKTVK